MYGKADTIDIGNDFEWRGSTPTERKFTGQIEEGELGIYFYPSRFYDPWLGRFLQADTIVPEPGNPQTWDRYAYVQNSPTLFIDPSGHYYCEGAGSCNHNTYHNYSQEELIDEIAKKYRIAFDGDWSLSERVAAVMGVAYVGHQLAMLFGGSSADAILHVYGQITFGKCGQGNFDHETCDAVGWAYSRNTLLFNPLPYADLAIAKRLVVHELGHAFDQFVCATSSGCKNVWSEGSARWGLLGKMQLLGPTTIDGTCCLGRSGYDGPELGSHWGFAGGWDRWQFDGDNGPGEVFADMFVGWIYNRWEESSRGDNRKYFMNLITWVYSSR